MNVISPVEPVEPVEEGDVFEWLLNIKCRSEKVLREGTRAKVVGKTDLTPHDEIMDRGYNLLIEIEGETTVWATFEQCLSRGLLKKVKSGRVPRSLWERVGGEDSF